MGDVSAPPINELAIDLLVLSARFARLASRESTSSIPRALWRTLAQLDELGPLRVSELAAATHVSQPTATSLLQRLGERGWVERAPDPDDARAVQVRISRAGRQALKENRQVAARAVLPRLERLDESSRQALADGLKALRLVLEDPPGDLPTADPLHPSSTQPTTEYV
jgi:DNA-binding MarR family transcriptional regulator